MTPDQVEALMFNGIAPPPGQGMKTTCPQCSHTRRKRREKCLRITPGEMGLVFVYCHHCGWEDAVA